MPETDVKLTLKEMTVTCRVSAKTVRARVRDGSLPAPIRLGRRRLWDRAEVEAALQKLKAKN